MGHLLVAISRILEHLMTLCHSVTIADGALGSILVGFADRIAVLVSSRLGDGVHLGKLALTTLAIEHHWLSH